MSPVGGKRQSCSGAHGERWHKESSAPQLDFLSEVLQAEVHMSKDHEVHVRQRCSGGGYVSSQGLLNGATFLQMECTIFFDMLTQLRQLVMHISQCWSLSHSFPRTNLLTNDFQSIKLTAAGFTRALVTVGGCHEYEEMRNGRSQHTMMLIDVVAECQSRPSRLTVLRPFFFVSSSAGWYAKGFEEHYHDSHEADITLLRASSSLCTRRWPDIATGAKLQSFRSLPYVMC